MPIEDKIVIALLTFVLESPIYSGTKPYFLL